eukprot:154709-Hanusia_phi.AAC.1
MVALHGRFFSSRPSHLSLCLLNSIPNVPLVHSFSAALVRKNFYSKYRNALNEAPNLTRISDISDSLKDIEASLKE